MKKSVLFIIDSLRCGGAEKSLVSLLPLLSQEKYSIDLWVLQRGGVFESLVPDGISFVPIPHYNLVERIVWRIAKVFYSLRTRWYKLIRKKKHGAEVLWNSTGFAYKVPQKEYDIAVAYQQGFPTYLVAEKISSKKKIAWVNADIFEVGYDILYNVSFYKRFDRIVPVSDLLKRKIEQRVPSLSDKLVSVYDILNPELICRLANEEVSDIPATELETITLVTVGRMVALKGYDLAVKAAAILHNKEIRFQWLLIGDGPQKDLIQDLIRKEELSDSVFIMGMKTNPYPYIKAADIYVQTSIFEGFGLTIGEAKILNKPIVSTDFDVVYDQLADGVSGLIVKKTAESIAEGIIRLIGDDELCKRFINYLKLEKNTTVSTEISKVERIFDDN